MLLKQLLLTQSDACRHGRRSTQRGQRSPPQSTAVSVPFCARSVQVPGSVQLPALQKPLAHCSLSSQS